MEYLRGRVQAITPGGAPAAAPTLPAAPAGGAGPEAWIEQMPMEEVYGAMQEGIESELRRGAAEFQTRQAYEATPGLREGVERDLRQGFESIQAERALETRGRGVAPRGEIRVPLSAIREHLGARARPRPLVPGEGAPAFMRQTREPARETSRLPPVLEREVGPGAFGAGEQEQVTGFEAAPQNLEGATVQIVFDEPSRQAFTGYIRNIFYQAEAEVSPTYRG